MALLIPAFAGPPPRQSPETRLLARRLAADLDGDHLCWQSPTLTPAGMTPDFVMLHPRRGLLVLSVSDWRPSPAGGSTPPPEIEPTRRCADALAETLAGDASLTFSSGRLQGHPLLPWSWGVVLTDTTRAGFEAAGLGDTPDARHILCADELAGAVTAESFRDALWRLFPIAAFGNLTPARLDRIRWHLFPDIRLPAGAVLDPVQERLARAPGGHQVIVGGAGSGKTEILLRRAEWLARRHEKPVLVLCRNKVLARRLDHALRKRGVADKVHVGDFQAWCHRLLGDSQVGLPSGSANDPAYWARMVERAGKALDRGLIAGGRYAAVLIDDAQAFPPEWLRLATRMADPDSDTVLALFDRTWPMPDPAGLEQAGLRADVEILDRQYRCPRAILAFSTWMTGARAPAPTSVAPTLTLARLPSLREEVRHLGAELVAAHRAGMPWRDMAVLYRHYDPVGKTVHGLLRQAGLPLTWKDNIRFDERQDTIKLLPYTHCAGLEFRLVALPGLTMPDPGAPAPEDETRLLHLAITRARERLLAYGFTPRGPA